MARQYKSYDEEYKKTIVNLYESGKGISELSREYGVGKSTIDSRNPVIYLGIDVNQI